MYQQLESDKIQAAATKAVESRTATDLAVSKLFFRTRAQTTCLFAAMQELTVLKWSECSF
jgi:hypothetical protein